MILVTGATGFVGRALLARLIQEGLETRILLRPSARSPELPRGTRLDVTLASLSDVRGLRAAMVGVDLVVHLAGAERTGSRDLLACDVEGTRTLTQAAVDGGVRRIIYLSHLGAEPASAFPLLRAKARAEESIRRCGIPYTILRTALLHGRGDHFSTWLAMQLALSPLVFPIPGDAATMLQPLWVEDLVTCLVDTLDDPATRNQVYEIGGPEFLSLRTVVQLVMEKTGIQRLLLSTRPPYLRAAARALQRLLPRPPVNDLWLDHFAVSRMAELSTLPRVFGLQPSRMELRLEHLRGHNWGWDVLAAQFSHKHEVVSWLSRS